MSPHLILLLTRSTFKTKSVVTSKMTHKLHEWWSKLEHSPWYDNQIRALEYDKQEIFLETTLTWNRNRNGQLKSIPYSFRLKTFSFLFFLFSGIPMISSICHSFLYSQTSFWGQRTWISDGLQQSIEAVDYENNIKMKSPFEWFHPLSRDKGKSFFPDSPISALVPFSLVIHERPDSYVW